MVHRKLHEAAAALEAVQATLEPSEAPPDQLAEHHSFSPRVSLSGQLEFDRPALSDDEEDADADADADAEPEKAPDLMARISSFFGGGKTMAAAPRAP